MIFWSIVLGSLAILLLLGRRADRRTRGSERVRRRHVGDSVRIEESKAQLNKSQTDRWGTFRGF